VFEDEAFRRDRRCRLRESLAAAPACRQIRSVHERAEQPGADARRREWLVSHVDL